jgi:hypothetical protein
MLNGAFLEIAPPCQQDVMRKAKLDVALQPFEQFGVPCNGRTLLYQCCIAR